MNYFRNIGKSLLMPIAVLPIAAIFAGLGNWLMSIGLFPFFANILFISGTAILANLPILFAIGLAFGLSRDKNGAAVLPAVVISFVIFKLLAPESLVSLLNISTGDMSASDALASSMGEIKAASFANLNNAFIGIMIGSISATLYNKFSNVELPVALSFFSGRRLVPIIAAIVGIVISGILFFIWPVVYVVLVKLGEGIVFLGPLGAGIYGFLNRLLIPTGLHNALNSVFWFDVAGISDISNYLGCTANNFDTVTGICMIGEGETAVKAIRGTTGIYQAGFFPIMMFGLPAASLAIYHCSLPENKKKVGSIFLAGAFASFFTGVTEPIEFAFMFVAWPLYVLHAALTGLSLFISSLLGYINGFGFSAGLVDYVLNFKNPLAVKPYMLIVQGLIFAGLYYYLFKYFIIKFNILTPGRTPGEFEEDEEEKFETADEKYTYIATKVHEIVGEDNLVEVDNCATRLRLVVKDNEVIDESLLKKLPISGIIKPSKDQIQIIVGPTVEFVAKELKRISNK